jgi:hypothetical protein
MSMATAMYFSGYDPFTLEAVYTAKSLREKRMMKALVLYWDKQHWPLAREALELAKRKDLIGRSAGCLIPPDWGDTRTRVGPAGTSKAVNRGTARPRRSGQSARRPAAARVKAN